VADLPQPKNKLKSYAEQAGRTGQHCFGDRLRSFSVLPAKIGRKHR
jgi:hypothetical protein